MAAPITTLPPELLHQILTNLNTLDNTGTPLLRHIHPVKGPPHIGVTFHNKNPDTSLFDAMRVCRSWRDVIFSEVLREDVRGWDGGRWREEGERMKCVERAVLVEIVRVVVDLWRGELGRVEIEEKRAREALLALERERAMVGGGEVGEGDADAGGGPGGAGGIQDGSGLNLAQMDEGNCDGDGNAGSGATEVNVS